MATNGLYSWLPLIAKQLGGVRHSREGVGAQTHFKKIIKQKKETVPKY